MNDLLLVGRGHSVLDFDRWDDFPDVMGVSSGIFAVPEQARPPRHFCTMDLPKWFLHGLHTEETTHAWQNDGHIPPWPFWKEALIQKHVTDDRNCHGGYRTLPSEVWDVIPEYAVDQFRRSLLDNQHLFGLQPGWGDFSNVTGWSLEMGKPPNFTSDTPIGMTLDGTHIRNSWFMSVQVAYRLGYRRLFFIGCDFTEERFVPCRVWAEEFYRLAVDAGMEWFNLSPVSVLGEFLPTPEGVAV